jgi:transposase InsO family protein
VRPLGAEEAIEVAENMRLIPPNILTTDYFNRVCRELGITDKRLYRKLSAREANHVFAFDVSGSEHFYVVRGRGLSSWLIGVRASTERVKVNRRVREDGTVEQGDKVKVWIYGTIDMYSRVAYIEPVIALGESAEDSALHLARALRQKPDCPLVGIPDMLMSDSGPLAKSEKGQGILEGLGIELETHMPERSWVKGVIERFWRSWFQKTEVKHVLNKSLTMPYEQLCELVKDHLAKYNGGKHPELRFMGKSRQDVYLKSLSEREVKVLPDDVDVLALGGTSCLRVVDAYGVVRIGNLGHEIADCPAALAGCKVVCRTTGAGEVQVRHPRTFEWLETKPWEPVVVGDFRGFKNDINTEIAEIAKAIDAPTIEQLAARGPEGGDGEAGKIVSIKTVQLQRAAARGFATPQDAVHAFERALGRAIESFEDPETRADLYKVIMNCIGDPSQLEENALRIRRALNERG